MNQSDPGNYRPIKLTSTHAKIVEYIMMLADRFCKEQVGSRDSRGATFARSLLKDVIKCFNKSGSLLYICSLDAQCCFDRLWHDALLYKMWDVVPVYRWLLLRNWYKNLKASVKWSVTLGASFPVQCGTYQGSVVAPFIFNFCMIG